LENVKTRSMGIGTQGITILAHQVRGRPVDEVAREFQLDEMTPGPPAGMAFKAERVASTQALLQHPDRLFGGVPRIDRAPATSRKRKS
jgi:hypothetical protein